MILSPSLQQQIGPMVQGQVTADDGAELLYQTFGHGPAILFANGIGVRHPGVVRQVEALRQTYRIICWDYRGMGQSVMPDPEGGDVSVVRHARDALCILDHLEVDRAILIGWSMGVQVSLEAFDLEPERVAGFVALLGTYARPFYNAFPAPVAWSVDRFFRFLHRNPKLAQRTLNLANTLPRLTFGLLSNVLFVGKDADREVFAADVLSVAGVDKSIYTRTMLAMAEHDAMHILPRLTCPSLIIAGERDRMTPPRVARRMADAIPDAEYREVKRGTHFSMIEQPELVNAWLMEFARRVFPEP